MTKDITIPDSWTLAAIVQSNYNLLNEINNIHVAKEVIDCVGEDKAYCANEFTTAIFKVTLKEQKPC